MNSAQHFRAFARQVLLHARAEAEMRARGIKQDRRNVDVVEMCGERAVERLRKRPFGRERGHEHQLRHFGIEREVIEPCRYCRFDGLCVDERRAEGSIGVCPADQGSQRDAVTMPRDRCRE